jgi:peptidoglycan lytic transglycosylase G
MTGPAPKQRGTQRTGIVEGWELRHAHKQDANSGAWKGFAFVFLAVALIAVGGWYVGKPVIGSALIGLFEENPGIINLPVVSDLLAAELDDRVDAPAGSDQTEIAFEIAPGQTIDEIQANLVDDGLLTDIQAFAYLVRKDRVDQLIQAGIYTMTPQITPREVVARLAGDPDPPPVTTVLDMRHGRRIEQITAYLQQQSENTDLELDASEFQAIATDPGPEIIEAYKFLRQIPAGNSLEGFLAGGTYEVEVDITAQELIFLMLDKWESESGGAIAQARKKNLDFYDMLTVASLVEREAKTDSDRAKVAGVYWNRLDPKVNGETGGLLQADPTVVYATDSAALADTNIKKWDEYLFWDLLGIADYTSVDVPRQYESFQTYQNPGLPDWPIVSPSAASIEATLNPATKSKLLYFYACEGSDTHRFAKTFKQHQNNIAKCG